MTWLQAIVLGIVQGLTEFLPISSSAHIRIVSELWFGGDAGASFTAVIQLGTETAVIIYFAKDIWRLLRAWFVGLFKSEARSDPDYKLAWYVIIGSAPIALLGVVFKDLIRSGLRNLWITAVVLMVFAVVLAIADELGKQRRDQLTMRDSIVMGFAQAMALVPGVSRSGGTLTAGMFLGLKREAATRYSFLLAIPAVFGAGIFSIPDVMDRSGPGVQASIPQTVVATAVSFVVGYACVAWLLRYVSKNNFMVFVWYRIALGAVLCGLLATGVVAPT
ncbi:undecaprenyl-diphosphate phosphatase [Actinokineospora globicatena]|uniref:undecaprenyl-diphosphate phosphatase n=1 Tax=Actinokineospora globicatena TaxID=103729 RepID=UPI0020A2DEB4|nr:undecaprenyl-diphosphate phosphatase [Actinokineospora globicatena]MCP2303242.1 undecaprenyl-diphosphatase [Actinokineospora globicatena]GLW79632.1 undecaprenyl-diphosphatase [Actinokineospora globicatena]GLW85958.1 undecaprenyl-diphosphatase [Actinokineospora globicatena]